MTVARSASQPQVRDRLTVAEVIDDTATVVMDATGPGSTLPLVTWPTAACLPSTASAVHPIC